METARTSAVRELQSDIDAVAARLSHSEARLALLIAEAERLAAAVCRRLDLAQRTPGHTRP